MSKIYIQINPDTELEISVAAREFNGINSDPRTFRREATAEELIIALRKIDRIKSMLLNLTSSSLNYPEQS